MGEWQAVNDRTSFELRREKDHVWLEHPDFGRLHLGAFDPVCDKLCDFLEQEALC